MLIHPIFPRKAYIEIMIIHNNSFWQGAKSGILDRIRNVEVEYPEKNAQEVKYS